MNVRRTEVTTYVELAAVVALFCSPLFIGLRNVDVRSDEAIYSYAVERILETGDWLTPRLIPHDDAFLEKPPLKLWLVAGAIRSGLVPRDEFGFRCFDVLFGGIAFVYVFALGRGLGGRLCGFISVLILFTFEPLVFEHGVRGNYMEAALVASYCGGIYHFATWARVTSRGSRLAHAVAFALWFVLGFMTKFVAALFLPLVCGMGAAWMDDARARLRVSRRDWFTAALIAATLIGPWFLYQTVQTRGELWKTMVFDQVLRRFSGSLHPQHEQPWQFYYAETWSALRMAGSHWISVLGVLTLIVKARNTKQSLARLLLLWWIVPFGVMSFSSAKLIHYTYPFLPPIALGAGTAATSLWSGLAHLMSRLLTPSIRSLRTPSVVRQLLIYGAILALLVTIVTAVLGPVNWEFNGITLFKNSSVMRPLFIAAMLFAFASHIRGLSATLAAMAIVLLLPLSAYRSTIVRLSIADHPLRTFRDCVISMADARPETEVFIPYEKLLNHSPYYYLHSVGPWRERAERSAQEEVPLTLASGRPTLIILTRQDYDTLYERRLMKTGNSHAIVGMALSEDAVLLTPALFEACRSAAIDTGGHAIP